jgi:integrase
MRKVERDKYISPEELEKFLKAAKKLSVFWHLLWFAHATFGTRIQELLLLRWKDIDFEESKVTIPTLKRDKKSEYLETRTACNGERYTDLPITLKFDNEDLFDKLKAYKKATEGKPDELVFPVIKRTAQYKFKEILRRAGLPDYSTHSFRHLQGLATYEATGDAFKTAHRLRHKKVETAWVYTHVRESEDEKMATDVNKIIFGGKK